jgi:hypothetical protein
MTYIDISKLLREYLLFTHRELQTYFYLAFMVPSHEKELDCYGEDQACGYRSVSGARLHTILLYPMYLASLSDASGASTGIGCGASSCSRICTHRIRGTTAMIRPHDSVNDLVVSRNHFCATVCWANDETAFFKTPRPTTTINQPHSSPAQPRAKSKKQPPSEDPSEESCAISLPTWKNPCRGSEKSSLGSNIST